MIQCGQCDGAGCDSCGEVGRHIVKSCPRKLIDGEMWSMIGDFSISNDGLWPVAGGTLDQTQSFLNARAIWQTEVSRLNQ